MWYTNLKFIHKINRSEQNNLNINNGSFQGYVIPPFLLYLTLIRPSIEHKT